ncbi:DinB family protein [Arundinibacter roseus]|uniref:DinB family protein n=1 Tax=Arundinibacter roseus TaxID=2070510 RepID=A0A4V6P8J8_9BACT|nr:DinB family protein [Arundinibacter roseus]TDB61805.1 DinB family protein [Arundinibacter roseus]
MNRQEALQQLAGALGILAGPQKIVSPYLTDFLPRWQTTLGYSLKVLEKMPAGKFSYTPSPTQRTFGQQFTHAAYWNSFYVGLLARQPPLPEPKELSKEIVIDYYKTCHAQCTAVFETLTDVQLDQTGYGKEAYWQKHTGRDILLRAYTHTAHHRAQALVYLRLNDIEPPFFEF